MAAKDYVQTKQVLWANRKKINLVKPNKDSKSQIYTEEVKENLYEDLEVPYEAQFREGDGGELTDTDKNAAKMKALHSSSAIGVNFFHYWAKRDSVKTIAVACKLCNKNNKNDFELSFEEKFEIDKSFQRKPNIDVVIKSKDSDQNVFAVESKFSEPYGNRHDGLSDQYIQKENLWDSIPSLYELAKTISPEDDHFKHLHPAQLIKHILGLKNKYDKDDFKLIYLWYDVPGPEGCLHRQEIEKFAKIAEVDGIQFRSITYQEVILNLYKNSYHIHNQYIDYLADRYL